MKKNILITIKGMQGNTINAEDIEMKTTGTIYEKNGKFYIQYTDTALDSETETKTTVKVQPGKVSVSRFGGANTHMIFEEGVTHFTPYETPFGIFEIMTHTEQIEYSLDKEELWLDLKYILEVNKVSTGMANFSLKGKVID